jgi:hypothetical protein
MWQTPDGPRRLKGRERAVFVEAVLTLYDLLRDTEEHEDAPETGVPIFDRVPIEDRRYVLLWVAEHVLGKGPAPPVRSWSAGTLGAVFAHLETMTALEIENEALLEDAPPTTTWRKLIHEAWMERCFPEIDVKFRKGEGAKQPLTSPDLDQWSFKIEGLSAALLEDADYAMEEIMDIPPQRASETKEYLGISEEYYTEPHPSFSEQERQRLVAFHRGLLPEASP